MSPDALATLLTDPARADALPREELPELLGQVERLRAALWVRLTVPATNGSTPKSEARAEDDMLLTATAVAEILNVDDRYVYRHADSWPFTRRLSRGTLRFSHAGLRRWIEKTGR